MEVLYLLIPLSVIFIILALFVWLWAVRSGQFDDLDSPAYRILNDDDIVPETTSKKPDAELPLSAHQLGDQSPGAKTHHQQ